MNTAALKFGLRFIVGFALLMGAFEASRGTAFERFAVEKLFLVPTTSLINALTPDEHIGLVGRILTSPNGANLRVTRGCEGIEMFLLLWAAILAFPAAAPRRIRGFLVGSVLAYILSITRLMALHYVLRYDANLWEALHGIVLPLGPVLVLSLYFLHWSSKDSHLAKELAPQLSAPRSARLDSRHVQPEAATASANIGVSYTVTANIANLSGQQTLTVAGGSTVTAPSGSIVLLTAQTGACATGSGSVCNGLWVVNTTAWTRPVGFPHGYVIPASCTLAVVDKFSNATFSLSDGSNPLTVDSSGESWQMTASAAVATAATSAATPATNAVKNLPSQTAGSATSTRSVNVLNVGTHADIDIAPAIKAALGTGFVDSSIFVDYDQDPVIGPDIADATNTSITVNSVATNIGDNHAPYGVINGSICCSQGEADDPTYYQALSAANALLSTPLAVRVGGALPAGTAPPTYNTASSSTNSNNGGTGWGIEFGLSASYLGLDTSEDSWVTAEVSGFLAALEFAHPAWTWFDVKAALRQTASNWSSGYAHGSYGYGLINWTAANALGSASSLYLQPPGLNVTGQQAAASITLYPFRQTRRLNELVYSVDATYVWPVKNEYTQADIAASNATLVYTSNGTDETPSFQLTPVATGTLHLVAFTVDNSGNYSRREEFSPVAISLTEGTACTN